MKKCYHVLLHESVKGIDSPFASHFRLSIKDELQFKPHKFKPNFNKDILKLPKQKIFFTFTIGKNIKFTKPVI